MKTLPDAYKFQLARETENAVNEVRRITKMLRDTATKIESRRTEEIVDIVNDLGNCFRNVDFGQLSGIATRINVAKFGAENVKGDL